MQEFAGTASTMARFKATIVAEAKAVILGLANASGGAPHPRRGADHILGLGDSPALAPSAASNPRIMHVYLRRSYGLPSRMGDFPVSTISEINRAGR